MKENLLKELKKLNIKKEKLTDKVQAVNSEIDTVKIKIQELCTHDWQHSYTNDHDGYSRVTYTETKTSVCKICGKSVVAKRDYDY